MDFEAFWHDLRRRRSERAGGEAEHPAPNLVVWRRAPSSHQLARRLVREYCGEDVEPPAIDVLAFEQTEGHGREGRPWSSPAGAGVWASVVRSVEPEVLRVLPLLVPVALVGPLDARLASTPGRCRIKWPNDLVTEGGKLGGILIDAVAQGRRQAAVISFGVNTVADLERLGQPGATSLGALGAEDEPLSSLAACLLEALDAALAAPPAELIERYRELSAQQEGEIVRWRRAGAVVEGVFRGFDDDGRLRLEVAGEERLVTAGDLLASGVASGEASVEASDDGSGDAGS